MDRIVLVLAPGYKKEMRSETPVGLHAMCGKTLLSHVTDALAGAGLTATLAVEAADKEEIFAQTGENPCIVLKNGVTAKAALEQVQGCSGCVLVTSVGLPLTTADTYCALVEAVEKEGCAMAALNEAAFCIRTDALEKLDGVEAEGFVGAALEKLAALGESVRVLDAAQPGECLRVANRATLAAATAHMRRRINEKLMENGATLIDPDRVYADCDVTVGRDTVIYPGCILENGTTIGEGCTLYANCRLNHARIGSGVTIESSVILDASVADSTTVGPYAYIRPNTTVGEGCRIGDFVELKNSHIGNGTKVSHLTYVGDSDLGEKINLGCGVVFVNYDGKKKQRSTVGDHAFIGCNVNLVAPVNVGKDAYIAAGSTVTCDVPEGAMLIARERETIKEGWVAARKESGKL